MMEMMPWIRLHWLSAVVAFAVSFVIAPAIIGWLRRAKAGQVIQKEGPQSHSSKAGTPAMGGIIILIGFLVTVLLFWTRLHFSGLYIPSPSIAALVLILVYALIGGIDDWLTIRPRNGVRGISSKPKFAMQFIAACGFVAYMWHFGSLNTVVDLGMGHHVDLGWAYAPLAVLFITGMANFVNITDGLDGLAAGLAVILAVTLFAANVVPYPIYEKAIFWAPPYLALAGACLGFLWYNFNPAKVFMGDTGSLALGVAFPAFAIINKLEIVMIIAGMVFILDGLSSAVQWAYFKYTRIHTGTGRRIFKMSPVHHHFEICGLPEQTVVIRFWITGAVCAVLSLTYWFWKIW